MTSRIRTTDTPLDAEIRKFVRHLMVVRGSQPNTIRIYKDTAERFAEYVYTHEDFKITSWEDIDRSHIEEFIGHLRTTVKGRDGKGASPGYLNNQYRALRQFFRWWMEYEAPAKHRDPMERVGMPKVKDQHVGVLDDEQIAAMIATCRGREFTQRRDLAILTLLFNTGMRRKELAGLRIGDIQIGETGGTVLIRSENVKTAESRTVGFGLAVADALDSYLSARNRHPQHDRPELWLGEKGRDPLTDTGVYQVIKRRGAKIGIKVYPHMLRHTWAHQQKEMGVPADEAMKAAGWKSPLMYDRYGGITAEARSIKRAQTSAPLDRILQDQRKGKKR